MGQKQANETMAALKPLGNRVAVSPDEPPAKSPGGILMPDTAKSKPARGRIVAVGPGNYQAGLASDRVPLAVAVGDEVVYGKYTGTEIEVEGKTFVILAEDEILAKIV